MTTRAKIDDPHPLVQRWYKQDLEHEKDCEGRPPMNFAQFIIWLAIYGYSGLLDPEWTQMAFEKWGSKIPFRANLSDCQEFEEVLNMRFDHPASNVDVDISRWLIRITRDW